MPIDLESSHGFPFPGTILGHRTLLVPHYHPGTAIPNTDKRSSFMISLQEDWTLLGEILRDDWSRVPCDEYPDAELNFRELLTVTDLETCTDWDSILHVSVDTEFLTDRDNEPWCVTFSTTMEDGFMIAADQPEILCRFGEYLSERITIIHYAPADLPILEQVGITIHPKRYVDTMMLAYHLGNLPQGLKPLSQRVCGIRMTDYADVVEPYGIREALEYLEMVGECFPLLKKPKKDPLLTKVERLMKDIMEKPKTDHVKRFRKWAPEDRKFLAGRWWGDADEDLPADPGEAVAFLTDVAEELKLKADDAATFGLSPSQLALYRAVRSKITSMVKAMHKNPRLAPWKKWDKLPSEVRDAAVEAVGGMEIPRAGIDRIPREVAITYAARDANSTLRVFKELRRRMRERKREVWVE